MNYEELNTFVKNNLSIGQISIITKKSKTAVRYWLKKHGLETTFISNNKKDKLEDIKDAVSSSCSFAEVCRKLNRLGAGGGYQNLKADIINNNIDTSHFTSKGEYNEGVKLSPNIVLVNNRLDGKREATRRLRRAMLGAGVDICTCSECGQGDHWNGKTLTMQIDHIDGIRVNNERSNLRILCPNCHTQTETFGNKK